MAWVQQALHLCRNDISRFNDLFLAGPPFWSGKASGHNGQIEWSNAVVRHKATAIETGNALGKDYWIGRVIPWWLCTRPNSLVIVTGPGQTILGSVTWKEVRRAIEGYDYGGVRHQPPIPIGARISTGVKTSPHVVDMGGGWQALGFSTTSVERASGQHADELLVIVEEASGVEDVVWDAIDGLKYTKLIAIGNPLRSDGGFVDMCIEGQSDARNGVPSGKSVSYLNTPSTASPHAHLEHSPYGLADLDWLEGMRRKYGEHSPWYRAHVLAIRPTNSHEALIQPAWLDRACSEQARLAAIEYRNKRMGGRKWLACDVSAGVGAARTVVVARDEVGVLELTASQWTNEAAAANEMERVGNRWGIRDESWSYDGAGQIGKKLGLALSGIGHPNVRAYFGGGSGGKRFSNARSMTAAAFARRLDPDAYRAEGREYRPFHIPNSEHLPAILEELRELRTCLKGDKTALEDKDEMALRLGRSPDYCDAITQTYREEAVTG